MLLPNYVMVSIYIALMLSLGLIVRRAYYKSRTGPQPNPEDLDQRVRFPYTAPPERRKRAFERAV
jgi:hypothetical protein